MQSPTTPRPAPAAASPSAGGDPERIGVFGGTFDPPHLGHLVVASEVRWRCGLDEMLLMVANDPWQKRGTRRITDASLRLEMVRRSVEGHDGLSVSALEVERGGPTYTIDTVQQLRAMRPGAEVWLVLGSDAVRSLDSWHRADELAGLVQIASVRRPSGPSSGNDPGAVASDEVVHPPGDRWQVHPVEVPLIELSSTEVRARCAGGQPTDFLVADPVRSIIAEHGLYGGQR